MYYLTFVKYFLINTTEFCDTNLDCMKPQLNAITIAVKDIVKLKLFYVELFEWEIMDESPDIVMFRLDHIILTLYKKKDHAKYLDLQQGEYNHPKFYLTINTDSRRKTDDLFAELKVKGVNIIKEPQQFFWGGYGGIIADPEDNYWEICYNPVS